MFDCFVWDYGGFTTILQEVCQEFEVERIQAQPLWPLRGQQASERVAIDCVFSHGWLQDLTLKPKGVDETIVATIGYEHVFEDGTGLMKVHRGKTHKYLGVTLDFSHDNQCRVTMIDYVDKIVVAYVLEGECPSVSSPTIKV